MLKKGKFKLPQKIPLQFPHKLSSLVSNFESKKKEAENVRIRQGFFEYGKELETFLPDAEVIEVRSEIPSEKFDGKVLEKGKHKNYSEALEIDEKRSDLEYEVNFSSVLAIKVLTFFMI